MNTEKPITIFVNGILHNNQRHILLLRRPSSDHFLPNYYELPGGRVEPDETLENALSRKFWQEVGIHIVIKKFVTSIADENKHGSYIRVFFEVSVDHIVDEIELRLDQSHDHQLWFNGIKDDYKIAPDTNRVLNFEEDEEAEQQAEIAPPGEGRHDTLIIYTDGGSRGNPGPSAAGYVIMDDRERILERGGKFMGVTTNNQAEYQAVRLALMAAQKYHAQQIHFRLDSLLVVNQMNGIYKMKNKDLWGVHNQIIELMAKFTRVDYRHVPREYNRLADGEVNRILDVEENIR